MHNSRNEAPRVARALAEHAERTLLALWGEPSARSPREARWGKHGARSACLAGEKRGLWQDFESGAGGDLLDLIAHVRGVSLGKAIDVAKQEFLGKVIIASSTSVRRSTAAGGEDGSARTATALRIWREARSIAGTLAELYFAKKRKLEIGGLSLGHVLRWHAGAHAVIALMTHPVSGEPVGIHRTFIDVEGAKIDRKMLGQQGVIRLSPDDAVTMSLGIAEGIEDGMAVLLSGWAPVWSATSAGAIARFPVLLGIESLTVFADADKAGMQSAETCRERWLDANREVAIVAPRRLK